MAPPGSTTRPTADRVRQALFDSLVHAPWAGPEAIIGAHVLDAFAGTGALGLEALSRGAMDAVFFETDAAARRVLSANISACGLEDRTRIVAADATDPPPGQPCSLVFLDPPYDDEQLLPAALSALASAGWIAPAALLVIEARARHPLPSAAGGGDQQATGEKKPVSRSRPRPMAADFGIGIPGKLLAERHYGAARIVFFRCP